MENVACKNCGAEVEANFCSNCGQKKQTRISIQQVSKDVYNGFFDFESPFLKTLVCLTVNPGKVYREYLDGARKRYFSPVRYSIWIMTLMVAVAGFTDTVLIDLNQFDLHHLESSMDTQEYQALKAWLDNFQAVINALLVPMYFLSAILMAGFLRLLFIKQPYTVAELFLPALLSYSHFTLFISLTLLLGIYTSIWTQLLSMVLSTGYMCWGLTQIYAPTKTHYYWKCLAASLLSALSIMLIGQLFGLMMGAM